MVSLIVLFILQVALGVFLLVSSKRITLKLAGLLFFGLGALIFALYINLRSYSAFTQEELAAKIKVNKVNGQLYDMVLKYSPVVNGISQGEDTYLLKGNQWMVDGDILKWKPALSILGFRTAYKITRISGRYLSAKEQARAQQTIYTINGGTDRFWLFLHKYQKFFPLAEAVYGNGAYAYADNNGTFGLFVTTSGFIIKRLNGK